MFNKQLENAKQVVGEARGQKKKKHILDGVGRVLEGTEKEEEVVEEAEGEEASVRAHMLIPGARGYNVLQASRELVMQGEHIIACGKISEGGG